jgi:hypothetical protein
MTGEMDEVKMEKAELRGLAATRTSVPHRRLLLTLISAPESS